MKVHALQSERDRVGFVTPRGVLLPFILEQEFNTNASLFQ
jgi:hypothetical protein